jgi:hypothetical protein
VSSHTSARQLQMFTHSNKLTAIARKVVSTLSMSRATGVHLLSLSLSLKMLRAPFLPLPPPAPRQRRSGAIAYRKVYVYDAPLPRPPSLSSSASDCDGLVNSLMGVISARGINIAAGELRKRKKRSRALDKRIPRLYPVHVCACARAHTDQDVNSANKSRSRSPPSFSYVRVRLTSQYA